MAKWLQVTLNDDTKELVNFDKVLRVYKHDEDQEGVLTVETDSETMEVKATMDELYKALFAGVC